MRSKRKSRSSTAESTLEGKALEAVERFREIVAALALPPNPTITLTADPTELDFEAGDGHINLDLDRRSESFDRRQDVGPPTLGSVDAGCTAAPSL